MGGPKKDLNLLGTKVWTGFGQMGFYEHDFELPSSINGQVSNCQEDHLGGEQCERELNRSARASGWFDSCSQNLPLNMA
jgi:hypothetical protein